MAEQTATWRQDGIDPGWFYADGIGSVRSSKSYNRPGGWWFLPAWLPDTEEHDVGHSDPKHSRSGRPSASPRIIISKARSDLLRSCCRLADGVTHTPGPTRLKRAISGRPLLRPKADTGWERRSRAARPLLHGPFAAFGSPTA